jgi:hypothetical protein
MDWLLALIKPLIDVMAKLWPRIEGALLLAGINKVKASQNETKQAVNAVRLKDFITGIDDSKLKRVRKGLDELRKRKL